ncbi:ankyrin repeat domain-containing protein [Legionella cincinnatiensis]|uniref:Ankyrin repeat protein n=1 Tax=Legionella cincinnatiensis TaxID=28085 RepID=A0A378IM96_9GAMM|nr:ankyrin repeat domain-containing protein [Legionella cincinnatiensis]KTC83104.1 Ankyrin repeat protein [Legionella cincinnatiensis]STX35765.1 Ankyrin repeat protein [Legionella cincinnatiensis]
MKFSPSTNPEHLEVITKPTLKRLVLKSDEELTESLKSLPKEIDFDVPDGDFNTVLYLAAANNYIKTVSYLLLERKVNPNIKVSEDLTAAHIAAANGHIDVLEKLASCEDIKFNEKDQYGETPLFRAIGNAPDEKLLEIVRLIVNKDPSSISVPNEDGIFPIELALQRQHRSVIQLLLENGADVNKRCSETAANMMMSQSVPSRQFANAFVFFTGSTENNNLRQCAKLIIEAYNKQHLAEDVQEMAANSSLNKL